MKTMKEMGFELAEGSGLFQLWRRGRVEIAGSTMAAPPIMFVRYPVLIPLFLFMIPSLFMPRCS